MSKNHGIGNRGPMRQSPKTEVSVKAIKIRVNYVFYKTAMRSLHDSPIRSCTQRHTPEFHYARMYSRSSILYSLRAAHSPMRMHDYVYHYHNHDEDNCFDTFIVMRSPSDTRRILSKLFFWCFRILNRNYQV